MQSKPVVLIIIANVCILTALTWYVFSRPNRTVTTTSSIPMSSNALVVTSKGTTDEVFTSPTYGFSLSLHDYAYMQLTPNATSLYSGTFYRYNTNTGTTRNRLTPDGVNPSTRDTFTISVYEKPNWSLTNTAERQAWTAKNLPHAMENPVLQTIGSYQVVFAQVPDVGNSKENIYLLFGEKYLYLIETFSVDDTEMRMIVGGMTVS